MRWHLNVSTEAEGPQQADVTLGRLVSTARSLLAEGRGFSVSASPWEDTESEPERAPSAVLTEFAQALARQGKTVELTVTETDEPMPPSTPQPQSERRPPSAPQVPSEPPSMSAPKTESVPNAGDWKDPT